MITDIDKYLQWIDCTWHARKTGLAITLMIKFNQGKSKRLIKLMEKFGQIVPPKLCDMAKRFEVKQNKDRAEWGNWPFRCRNYGRRFSCGSGKSLKYYKCIFYFIFLLFLNQLVSFKY